MSAWFHDIGNCRVSRDHEGASIDIFGQFAASIGLANGIKNYTEQQIRATKINHRPQNLLEKIICDADLHHLDCMIIRDGQHCYEGRSRFVMSKSLRNRNGMKRILNSRRETNFIES
jgi:predicted metal-dependent HD superfamily phosphohydrolase